MSASCSKKCIIERERTEASFLVFQRAKHLGLLQLALFSSSDSLFVADLLIVTLLLFSLGSFEDRDGSWRRFRWGRDGCSLHTVRNVADRSTVDLRNGSSGDRDSGSGDSLVVSSLGRVCEEE